MEPDILENGSSHILIGEDINMLVFIYSCSQIINQLRLSWPTLCTSLCQRYWGGEGQWWVTMGESYKNCKNYGTSWKTQFSLTDFVSFGTRHSKVYKTVSNEEVNRME